MWASELNLKRILNPNYCDSPQHSIDSHSKEKSKDGWADNQACENSRTIVNVSAFYGEECVLENWLCVECGSLRLLHITRTRESCLEQRNNIVHSQKHVYIREPCSDLRFMALQLITNMVIMQHHRKKTQTLFLNTHPVCSVKFMIKQEARHEWQHYFYLFFLRLCTCVVWLGINSCSEMLLVLRGRSFR